MRHIQTTRPSFPLIYQSKMLLISTLLVALATVVSASPHMQMARGPDVPSLDVPACGKTSKVTINYRNTVPSTDNSPFPCTQVSLCYDDAFIYIGFTALNETSFYCECRASPPAPPCACLETE